MKRIALSIFAGLGVIFFFAFVSWANGFNFDHRGDGVALICAYAIFFACGAAAAVWGLNDD